MVTEPAAFPAYISSFTYYLCKCLCILHVLCFSCSALKSHIDKPALISMEAIPSLDPGQKDKRTLLVRFHHHLLPLKLALFCNDKKFPVKLRPDIGYFVKPLSINIEDFRDKESHLPGMFEYVRRYVDFVVCWTNSQDCVPNP